MGVSERPKKIDRVDLTFPYNRITITKNKWAEVGNEDLSEGQKIWSDKHQKRDDDC